LTTNDARANALEATDRCFNEVHHEGGDVHGLTCK
jgi:hypothetical protein